MRDNDLDDLILEDEESKGSNGLKNILTIVALIFIILIVAMLLTKIILKEPKSDDLAFEQTYNKTIDPELKLEKESNTTTEAVKSEPLSTLIDEESNKTEIKQDVKAAVTPKAEEKTDTKTETTTQPKKPATKKEKTPTVTPAVQTPAKVETKVTQTPKQTVTEGTYYVQVGAYKTQPNKTFLDIIKKSGYSYETRKVNDRTKLLIGPYKNREEASNALIRIKDRINKNAFLVQY
jgi:cell division septation protein DedD